MKKLYRSDEDVVLTGVAGGMAEYFEIDSTIIRLIFLFLLFFLTDKVIVFYMFAALLMPQKPHLYHQQKDELENINKRMNELEKKFEESEEQSEHKCSDDIDKDDDTIEAVGEVK